MKEQIPEYSYIILTLRSFYVCVCLCFFFFSALSSWFCLLGSCLLISGFSALSSGPEEPATQALFQYQGCKENVGQPTVGSGLGLGVRVRVRDRHTQDTAGLNHKLSVCKPR
jgi:hypothetical protein